MPIVMEFSSIETICALALSSDQVKRRFFFTSSITSGQIRRKPVTSIAELLATATVFSGAADSGSAFLESAFSGKTVSATGAEFSTTFWGSTALTTGVEIDSARSRRSMRLSNPRSLVSPPGNKMRPQISSRIKRGAVAPRIWVRPSAAISAARERFAAPI